MATEAQINANRANAAKSTGPRTTEGLHTSSRNAVTTGFWTQTDYVLPGEEEIYHLFVTDMRRSCEPVDILEEHLADGELASNSIIDPALEKRIRSIERARAHSTAANGKGISRQHRHANRLHHELRARRLGRSRPPNI